MLLSGISGFYFIYRLYREIKLGIAKFHYSNTYYEKHQRPIKYWLTIAFDFLSSAIPLTIFIVIVSLLIFDVEFRSGKNEEDYCLSKCLESVQTPWYIPLPIVLHTNLRMNSRSRCVRECRERSLIEKKQTLQNFEAQTKQALQNLEAKRVTPISPPPTADEHFLKLMRQQ